MNASIKQKERQSKQEYERLRWVIWSNIRPHTKNNFQPRDALKLPWDKPVIKSRSVQELKQIIAAAEIKRKLENG